MHYESVERVSGMSFGELHERFLRHGTPVVITDIATQWPALQRWTPDFFRKAYGDRWVDTYDESFQEPGRNYLGPIAKMRLADFIDAIEAGPTNRRLFLFELFRFAPELRNDVVLPSWVDSLSRLFLVSFFGGEGGLTTFHYDVDLPHVFHAVLHGEKEFYLFGPDQSDRLYRHPFTVRSYVNADDPDLDRFPRFAEAEGHRVAVKRGETLAIPSGQWHQVVYRQPSWGLAFRKYEARKVPRALYNMAIQESVDRLLTRAMPKRWFAYKERRAAQCSA